MGAAVPYLSRDLAAWCTQQRARRSVSSQPRAQLASNRHSRTPSPLTFAVAYAQLQVMTRPALLSEILDLPATERLRLVEDILDSLGASIDDLPVPDWHREELDRRLADPTEQATLSADEIKARLR